MAKKDFTWEFDLDQILGGGYFDEDAYDFVGALTEGLSSSRDILAERIHDRILLSLDGYGLSNSGIPQHINVKTYDTTFEKGFDISLDEEGKKYEHVEFGTGIVGKQGVKHPFLGTPHNHNWDYDVNDHGKSGWWYPTDADDDNPTKREGSDGKLYAWTKGQRARPFMYAGWLYGSQAAISTIRSNINKELAILEAMAK